MKSVVALGVSVGAGTKMRKRLGRAEPLAAIVRDAWASGSALCTIAFAAGQIVGAAFTGWISGGPARQGHFHSGLKVFDSR